MVKPVWLMWEVSALMLDMLSKKKFTPRGRDSRERKEKKERKIIGKEMKKYGE